MKKKNRKHKKNSNPNPLWCERLSRDYHEWMILLEKKPIQNDQLKKQPTFFEKIRSLFRNILRFPLTESYR